MQGKRMKKSTWKTWRLLPLALLLAAVFLLPGLSTASEKDLPEPPAEEPEKAVSGDTIRLDTIRNAMESTQSPLEQTREFPAVRIEEEPEPPEEPEEPEYEEPEYEEPEYDEEEEYED